MRLSVEYEVPDVAPLEDPIPPTKLDDLLSLEMQGIWCDRQIKQTVHRINIGTETLLGRRSVVEKSRQSLRIRRRVRVATMDSRCQK
jgi:hypothetical protein